MDCNDALAKLELSRFEVCAQDDPELAAASAHLVDCARCRTIVANRDEMDRAIAAVCRDVPIPAGLESRLLETVQNELASNTIPLSGGEHRQPLRRRRLRRISAVAAGLLCFVVGGWYWLRHAPVDADAVTVAAMQQLDARQPGPLFTGLFDPREHFPTTSMDFPASLHMEAYRELFPQQQRLDIAISEFNFRSGGRMIHGALIIAPASSISPAPAATSMAGATPTYQSRFSAVSWRAGDFVYICLVQGGEAPLRELQRQVREQTT